MADILHAPREFERKSIARTQGLWRGEEQVQACLKCTSKEQRVSLAFMVSERSAHAQTRTVRFKHPLGVKSSGSVWGFLI